jgi:uncharacterized membrane protein
MPHKRLTAFIHQLSETLWKIFLSGLLTILPLTLTIALFNATFRLMIAWLEPLRRFIDIRLLDAIPHAELIVVIIIIFGIGTLYNIFLLDHIIHGLELLVSRIPLVRPVYSGLKQLVSAFGSQDKFTFKKVVLVEFPRVGLFSIGFLTSELNINNITPGTGEKYFSVFIPTTPNPTSGFCIIALESQIIVTEWSRQEAMAMIISGGIIQPEQSKTETE